MADRKSSKPVRRGHSFTEGRRAYMLPFAPNGLTPEGNAAWRRWITILNSLWESDADFIVWEMNRIANEAGANGLRPFKPDIERGVDQRYNRSLGPEARRERAAPGKASLEAAILAAVAKGEDVKAVIGADRGDGSGKKWGRTAVYAAASRLQAESRLPGLPMRNRRSN